MVDSTVKTSNSPGSSQRPLHWGQAWISMSSWLWQSRGILHLVHTGLPKLFSSPSLSPQKGQRALLGFTSFPHCEHLTSPIISSIQLVALSDVNFHFSITLYQKERCRKKICDARPFHMNEYFTPDYVPKRYLESLKTYFQVLSVLDTFQLFETRATFYWKSLQEGTKSFSVYSWSRAMWQAICL